MAQGSLPILPFPDSIDRQRFGDYLAGFVDGEGSFTLSFVPSRRNRRPVVFAAFGIQLRADDLHVLRLIHSFFGCGHLNFVSREDQRRQGGKTKDCYQWAVTRTPHLATILVPHFDRYPLYAKKRRDFAIWKEGVQLLHQCNQEPRTLSGRTGGLKWTDDRVDRFRSLVQALKANRQFKMPTEAASLPAPTAHEPPPAAPSLFDGLD